MRITLWINHHSLKMEENVKTSETITKIAPALVKAIGDIKGAAKDGTNPHFRSSYSTLSSVIDAARIPLLENELFIIQSQDGITDNSTIVLATRIVHSSGEWFETYTEAKLKNADPQTVGSCLTYLKRYGYTSALSISHPSEDDDGNSATHTKDEPVKSIDLEPLLIEISESMQDDDLKAVAKKIRKLKCNNADLATLKKAWSEQKAAIVAAEKAEAQ